jgi:hypothetical protein
MASATSCDGVTLKLMPKSKERTKLANIVKVHITYLKSFLADYKIILPTVKVRIAHASNECLGMGVRNGNIIWIPENTVAKPEILKHVVYHELLHACYDIEHDKECPLMSPTVSKDVQLNHSLNNLFLGYVLA